MAAQLFQSGTPAQLQGNLADYHFGTLEHGWRGFKVVRWHAVEELSRPFQYEITLIRDAALGEPDLDRMLGDAASFRIESEAGARIVHGLIAEVEELDRTSKLLAHRVLLVPHLWRSRHRRACRLFIERPVIETIENVLRNATRGGAEGLIKLNPDDPVPPFDGESGLDHFDEPQGLLRVVLATDDSNRLQDSGYRTQLAQYNESDFDFVSRIMEEEGLTYFFEHGAKGCVMTITDRPGFTRLFGDKTKVQLNGNAVFGTSAKQEVVRSFRPARRMRSRGVRFRSYDEDQPMTRIESSDRQAVLFAATFEQLALNNSIVLIDEPALHQDPRDHARFFRALVALGADNQVISASSSPAVLSEVPRQEWIDLGL